MDQVNNYVLGQVKKHRLDKLEQSDQLTLGELIAKLEAIAANRTDGDSDPAVCFDFCGMIPVHFDSYRGSYEELALSFADRTPEPVRLSNFIKACKHTVGCTFMGYKGGEFTMDETTPVWVDNFGQANSTAVIDVIDAGYFVVLATGYREMF